jgi:hypothetical protein
MNTFIFISLLVLLLIWLWTNRRITFVRKGCLDAIMASMECEKEYIDKKIAALKKANFSDNGDLINLRRFIVQNTDTQRYTPEDLERYIKTGYAYDLGDKEHNAEAQPIKADPVIDDANCITQQEPAMNMGTIAPINSISEDSNKNQDGIGGDVVCKAGSYIRINTPIRVVLGVLNSDSKNGYFLFNRGIDCLTGIEFGFRGMSLSQSERADFEITYETKEQFETMLKHFELNKSQENTKSDDGAVK